MNDTTHILQDAAAWQKALDDFTQGKNTRFSSTSGLFYNPELHANGEGGFFPPVTEKNYEAAIQHIFADSEDKGKWFSDYLKSGNKEGLDDQQRAFVEAYDRLMVGFLDSRTLQYNPEIRNQNVLTSQQFSDAITRDETLTDAEYRVLLKGNGFDDSIEKMGPLGLKWIYLTGGIIQGVLDQEPQKGSARVFYSPEELMPFYTAALREKLDSVNASNWIIQSEPDKKNLAGYVELMNNSCSKDAGMAFTPASTPALLIPENEKDYGR